MSWQRPDSPLLLLPGVSSVQHGINTDISNNSKASFCWAYKPVATRFVPEVETAAVPHCRDTGTQLLLINSDVGCSELFFPPPHPILGIHLFPQFSSTSLTGQKDRNGSTLPIQFPHCGLVILCPAILSSASSSARAFSKVGWTVWSPCAGPFQLAAS